MARVSPLVRLYDAIVTPLIPFSFCLAVLATIAAILFACFSWSPEIPVWYHAPLCPVTSDGSVGAFHVGRDLSIADLPNACPAGLAPGAAEPLSFTVPTSWLLDSAEYSLVMFHPASYRLETMKAQVTTESGVVIMDASLLPVFGSQTSQQQQQQQQQDMDPDPSAPPQEEKPEEAAEEGMFNSPDDPAPSAPPASPSRRLLKGSSGGSSWSYHSRHSYRHYHSYRRRTHHGWSANVMSASLDEPVYVTAYSRYVLGARAGLAGAINMDGSCAKVTSGCSYGIITTYNARFVDGASFQTPDDVSVLGPSVTLTISNLQVASSIPGLYSGSPEVFFSFTTGAQHWSNLATGYCTYIAIATWALGALLFMCMRSRVNRSSGDLKSLPGTYVGWKWVVCSMDVSNNDIRSTSSLDAYPNLTDLNCASNDLTRFGPVGAVVPLERLNLWNNDLTTLDNCSFPSTLINLDVGNNDLTAIKPGNLANCPQLQVLKANNNDITDITGLHQLTHLTFLDLSQNDLADAQQVTQLVHSLRNLQRLDVRGNNFKAQAIAAIRSAPWPATCNVTA